MGKTKICRHCGNEIRSDAKKCKFCKKELEIENTPDMFCKRCKAPVNEADNFCQYCGAIFNIPEDLDNHEKHNINGIPYNLGIFLKALTLSFAVTVFSTSGKDMTSGGTFIYYSVAFLISEVFLYIYFLPSIIAIENNKPNMFFLYICNLFLGVTIVGWFIALKFALSKDD